MRVLAGWVAANQTQAILVVVLSTVLSFLAPPLTSLLSYLGAAALALFSLMKGSFAGMRLLLICTVLTGILAQLLFGQGIPVALTSLMIWAPVWIAAWVLNETRSLSIAALALSGLAMLGVLLVFAAFGDPTSWWLDRMQMIIAQVRTGTGTEVDLSSLDKLAQQVAPMMTGSLAAGLALAAFGCLVLGRWWQSLLLKPGALREEFFALRLNRGLSLLGAGVLILAIVGSGIVGVLAKQWALIVLMPFLFVGLAVLHATLAKRKSGRVWLIAIYVLMTLMPQFMLMVAFTGILDPWVDLRKRSNADTIN